MRILKMLFGNKELDTTFIDGGTTFVLSSDEGEGGIFQNISCSLVGTIKYKGDKLYLVETAQTFTGVDFGIGAVSINKFFITIRRPSTFEKSKKNDVLVYLPVDKNKPAEGPFEEMVVIDWAIISEIRN